MKRIIALVTMGLFLVVAVPAQAGHFITSQIKDGVEKATVGPVNDGVHEATAKPVKGSFDRVVKKLTPKTVKEATASVPGGPSPETLAAIRSCESGGDYTADTDNGFFGAYQFMQGTWEAVGGSGNPAEASPAEQDKRAAILYAQSGAGQWPVCGS